MDVAYKLRLLGLFARDHLGQNVMVRSIGVGCDDGKPAPKLCLRVNIYLIGISDASWNYSPSSLRLVNQSKVDMKVFLQGHIANEHFSLPLNTATFYILHIFEDPIPMEIKYTTTKTNFVLSLQLICGCHDGGRDGETY